MTTPDIWFDLLLAVLIVVLAWRALRAPQLFPAAILFIAFGLSMALAWTRLAAPDVALAEAAIGTGLLGILLIDSLRIFAGRKGGNAEKTAGYHAPAATAAVVLTTASLGTVLVAAILRLPESGGLTARAAAEMDASGVEHPVTAVLLNFRGYDTWLEVGVLLLAMLGIFAAGGFIGYRQDDNADSPGLVLSWLVRLLVPLMVLTGGYLLWLGKFAPGGAFQAGVVFGAAGIFLHLAGFRFRLSAAAWKTGLLLGFGGFLLFGIATWMTGRTFLEYPFEIAGHLILAIEAAAALSIGFTLAFFFIYLTAADRDGPKAEKPGPTGGSHEH